jgi:hypothetical protein
VTDNVQITAGSGTIIETIDEGGGVERQVIVLGSIGDASGETQLSAGQKTSANSIPIVIASDQSIVPVSGTFWQTTQPISVADGSNVTIGAKADAKNSATDTTAISAMSVWKQISSSIQAATASLAGTLTVATHAVTQSGTWTVLLGQTGADGSTSISTGGTAQNLFSGTTPTNGFEVCNPDPSEDLWISDSTTAALNGQGSYRVAPAGGTYTTPAGYKPIGAVSAIATTTGHKITARRW